MAARIHRFPGVTELAPREPCKGLIGTLEHALELARSGEMVGFAMVFEKPGGVTGSLTHLCGQCDSKQIIAALAIEQHIICADLASTSDVHPVTDPHEGA